VAVLEHLSHAQSSALVREAVTGVCCKELTFLTNANDRKNEKGV